MCTKVGFLLLKGIAFLYLITKFVIFGIFFRQRTGRSTKSHEKVLSVFERGANANASTDAAQGVW